MKKTILISLVIAISFLCGFTFKTILTPEAPELKKGRVTGIGGIFFKCKDTKKMKEWYKANLGLNTNKYGTVFEWWQ